MTANPTHKARADQHHGEELPEQAQPGEGEAVRYGMESNVSRIEQATLANKAKKAAAKARDKERAKEWKAEFEAKSQATPGMFDPSKYRCWMMGNGQKGR